MASALSSGPSLLAGGMVAQGPIQFWKRLGRGEYEAGEYKRLAKGGREVWLQSSYNPILSLDGKPFKVVKYASDVTAQKMISADFAGQIEAIGKSQAVIEFNLDGTIITANNLFCGAMGYSLNENSSTLRMEPVGTVWVDDPLDAPREFTFTGRIENHPARPGRNVGTLVEVAALNYKLKHLGVNTALVRAGVQEGDEVRIGDFVFEYEEDA